MAGARVGCLEAEPALAGLCLPGKYSAGKLLVAGEMVGEIKLAAGLGIQGKYNEGAGGEVCGDVISGLRAVCGL